ncbi:hypothetical protein [Pseudotenacibaculum haliotis]|uniref:Uncharacterized protein n=1 Tax=Pseudotenacibaculum haliotis TaxID=1862138 RepID=A0ABW5LMJ9_9FLAO
MSISVNFAVYGALNGGNENKTQAIDVSAALQAQIDANQGIVKISNSTMGCDPSVGNKKHFAASLNVDGTDNVYFACEEGQTVDFHHWIASDCS